MAKVIQGRPGVVTKSSGAIRAMGPGRSTSPTPYISPSHRVGTAGEHAKFKPATHSGDIAPGKVRTKRLPGSMR